MMKKEDVIKQKKELFENYLFNAFAEASKQVYIYVCDVASDITRWSANTVEYFDLPEEYIVNSKDVWGEHIHPDDIDAYMEDITAVFSGRKRKHACEYRARNKYGDYVWLECRGAMLRDEAGNLTTFAGMMTRLDADNKYDPLTNLKTIYEFNKRNFSQSSGTILLVGIDSFRTVVNNFGYGFGNGVLVTFCKKMEEYCGSDKLLYRMGGDEFIIVSPGLSRSATEALFQDIKELAADVKGPGGHSINLSISGGAVRYPQDGAERDILISNMEHSLEHAKRFARGTAVFFSHEIAYEHQQTNRMRQAITRSISNGFKGFELHYQPMVNMEHHKVLCCEALLRWSDEAIGSAGINEVIKLVEASGQIQELGDWIVDQVYGTARKWQDRFPGFMVGFNVSYKQFRNAGFTDSLIEKARALKLKLELLCIELTESSDVDDFESLVQSFKKLRAHGFCISLDDFGIAYSTLQLLRKLPVDSVKIEHSFVKDLTEHNETDLAIVESVIFLCKRLNIHVVVEGVETEKILEIVSRYPVSLLQGYYFDKPMPADAFEKVIFTNY